VIVSVLITSLRCSLAVGLTMLLGYFQPVAAEDAVSTVALHKSTSRPIQYRLALGIDGTKILNPEGFDISTSAYETGFSDGLFNVNGSFEVSGEKPMFWQNNGRILGIARVDHERFNGLVLDNLTFGLGGLFAPSYASWVGARFSAGAGL